MENRYSSITECPYHPEPIINLKDKRHDSIFSVTQVDNTSNQHILSVHTTTAGMHFFTDTKTLDELTDWLVAQREERSRRALAKIVADLNPVIAFMAATAKSYETT